MDLSEPRVMGIINVSPDSFYAGSKYREENTALQAAEKMISAGADILDIGGMSSRPGAAIIHLDDELERVLPPIKAIVRHFPEAIISIDTVRGEVARQAIAEGAAIVNDISAGKFDRQMFETVARLDVPYILMHMQGEPANMQANPTYTDVVRDILDFFIEKVGQLRALGVKDIILDPGFGFGKTVAHNYDLLNRMDAFKVMDLPVLAGLSRKSMICKALEVDPAGALNGTTALHMAALLNGAEILRVHDVKEAKECIKLYQHLKAT